MKSKLLVVVAIGIGVTAFLAGTALSGEGDQEKQAAIPEMPPPPQLKALEAFVGDWRYNFEHLPAMFGEPGKGSGMGHAEWVLDGWFVMSKTSSTGSFGSYKDIWLATYDPWMQTYRSFMFDNHGSCDTATMSYEPETKTWTMGYEGFDFMAGKPAKNKNTMRFVTPDKVEWQWHQKTEGETEFKLMMRGTDTRVPKKP